MLSLYRRFIIKWASRCSYMSNRSMHLQEFTKNSMRWRFQIRPSQIAINWWLHKMMQLFLGAQHLRRYFAYSCLFLADFIEILQQYSNICWNTSSACMFIYISKKFRFTFVVIFFKAVFQFVVDGYIKCGKYPMLMTKKQGIMKEKTLSLVCPESAAKGAAP